MSEPLNTYTVKHYLDFRSDNTGRVQIDEPTGFDASNFLIEQRSDGYGRDLSFSGSESEYTFSRQHNIYGHYFDKLVEHNKTYGYETEVFYILNVEDEDYIVGQLDFPTATTDEFYDFNCVVIQDSSQAILKRRESVKVKLFSNEDLDGNPINPVATENILIKAKPVIQASEWSQISETTISHPFLAGGGGTVYYNANLNLTKSNIESTNNYFNFYTSNENNLGNVGFIDALNDLTDVKIDINLKALFSKTSGDFTNNPGSRIRLRYGIISDIEDPVNTDIVPFTTSWLNGTFGFEISDASPSLDIDFSVSRTVNVPRSHRLIIYFEQDTAFLGGGNTDFNIQEFGVNITAQATAIDSVSKGVRLIDAMKQVSSSINPNFTLEALRFSEGGEWYDNFVFSGNMLRGRDTFVLEWKDIVNGLQEFNSDYEINKDQLSVIKYNDFYANTEIGVFPISPDEAFNTSFNEKYAINQLDFKYKNFNQDKDDANTIDAVHTESQWLNANRQVQNIKEIEIDFIRDPFLLETTRKKAITEEASSLSEDDKVFINDVVPLAPNTRSGFTASLTHFINEDGNLQLLGDGSFNWSLLGFNEGSDFVIENTDNNGTYTVLETTNTIITLSGGSPSFTGATITEVNYPLNNVAYVIRTNEGFDSIEGILAPDNYANLRYTIKRNILNNWGSYIATSTLYRKAAIRNTYFKNEPEEGFNLKSQFNGEDVIVENANIEQSELSEPILSPRIIETKVLSSFSEYQAFANKLTTERGFVRIYDTSNKMLKGYVQKSDFKWVDNVLSLTLEEKFESDIITITFSNGIYTINEAGYPLDVLPEIITSSEDDYIQIFDTLTRPLINRTRYDKVLVNGQSYNSIVELQDAILAL